MLNRRIRYSSLHLLFSAGLAGVVGLIVFRLWYPPPFSAISGGVALFVLVVCVDVVLGPLLTAVVASPTKPQRELRRDLALIVGVQLAGLAFGVYTLGLARPVLISFEIDRYRVVTAADIDVETLNEAPANLRRLSWTGPRMIAAVKPSDPAEQMRSIELGFAGVDLSMLPKNWRDYSSQRDAVNKAAHPLSLLLGRYPGQADAVRGIASRTGVGLEHLRFLPVLSRQASWAAVISVPDARILGYLPVDGFL